MTIPPFAKLGASSDNLLPGNMERNTSNVRLTMAQAAMAVCLALGVTGCAKEDPDGHGINGPNSGLHISQSKRYLLEQQGGLSAQLPQETFLSLAEGRARLMDIAEALNNGTMSIGQLIDILKSDTKIIADRNTYLRVKSNFPVRLKQVVPIGDDTLEFTDPYSLVTQFLTPAKVQSAEVEGDTLVVIVTGEEYERRGDPNDAFVEIEGSNKRIGVGTYMLNLKISPK